MTRTTARKLNSEWNVGVVHALYSKVGDWYHTLRSFPAALFDDDGYIKFETREEYDRCSRLHTSYDSNTTHAEAPGIRAIPGYIRVRSIGLA